MVGGPCSSCHGALEGTGVVYCLQCLSVCSVWCLIELWDYTATYPIAVCLCPVIRIRTCAYMRCSLYSSACVVTDKQ